MAGITRINIIDEVRGRGAYRFTESRQMQPVANKLYREIFAKQGMPLAPGDEQIDCTRQEFEAGYDYQLGIDVFLTFSDGTTDTLQEKFLTTRYETVTVEYMNDHENNVPGDWFHLRANYYFVGYYENSASFARYILLDWPETLRFTRQERIPWDMGYNRRDGARASFKHTHFDNIPMACYVAKHFKNGTSLPVRDLRTYRNMQARQYTLPLDGD